MNILTYLFKKPQTGDKGSVFWPALEDDIQQMNDHTHNGSDSAPLTSASVTAVLQTVTSAGWASQGGGTYRQLVTMPGTLVYNNYDIVIKNNDATRERLFLAIEKVSSNTFYVYCNDNSIGFIVHYVS